MDSSALVSIGMPVYNEGRHLVQALDSVLGQDYGNFELIISDNASDDDTPRICGEYAERDKRLRYFRNQRNVGINQNFNRAFELSRGEYFVWASGSDFLDSRFLSRCVSCLAEDASVVLCYPAAVWVGADSQPFEINRCYIDTRAMSRYERFQVVLWGHGHPYPVYGVIRSSALRHTRLFRQAFGADGILLVELSFLGAFAHIPETLLYIRRHADYGNFAEYIKKCFNRSQSGWAVRFMFWLMVYEYWRVVARHAPGCVGRAMGWLSVTHCMLTKYSWARKGLLDLSRRNRRERMKRTGDTLGERGLSSGRMR